MYTSIYIPKGDTNWCISHNITYYSSFIVQQVFAIAS